MNIDNIKKILREQREKASKIKSNDIPHIEEELKQAKTGLQELEINIKYLKDFLALYKALQDREII